MTLPVTHNKGLIAWFVQNHVAANLLMLFFLLGGFLILGLMNREIFPTIDPKIITVSVAYPGASAQDVEEGITRRVEEAVLSTVGIKRITSTASENIGIVTLELEEYADPSDVYNDVRDSVGEIINFPPQNAENIVIKRVKPKSSLMQIALYGDISEHQLQDYAEFLEQDILNLPLISEVSLTGGRNREITIEVDKDILEKYNLTHQDIAERVQASSHNIPAGFIRSKQGDILVRVNQRKYYAKEYEDIIIKALSNGTVLYLKDIATVIDGFEDKNVRFEYNQKPALILSISRNPNQDVIEMEDQVNAYLSTLKIPQDISLEIKRNSTDPLKDRTNLMIKNALGGFVLLFICLLIFLDLKLAFWISMGVPISFMGGLMVSYFLGVNMNMITLFALIVVIGVVVDDAIIIGESIFYEQENPQPNDKPLDAVIRGVQNVIAPATVGVLTTIIAFVPLLLTTGTFGQILRVIPIIVICILAMSLLEAYFILPAHLSSKSRWSRGAVKDIQTYFDKKLVHFTETILVPIVQKTLQYRYATLTGVFCFIAIGFMAISQGVIRIVFFPIIEGTKVTALLEMPIDTEYETTEKNAEILLSSAQKTIEYFQKKSDKIYDNISFSVGSYATEAGPGGGGSNASGNHLAYIDVQLVSAEERDFTALEFERVWRKKTPSITGVRSLAFQSSLIRSGNDLEIELKHKNSKTLEAAAHFMREEISKIEGVVTLKESTEIGKKELHFSPSSAGYAAGLTPQRIGTILRGYFNGIEVTRVQRGKRELRVMVRLPESQRKDLATLNQLKIQLPNGGISTFGIMTEKEVHREYSVINRTDGNRVITLLGDIDETIRTTDEVTSVIEQTIRPQLLDKFQGINYSYEGSGKERSEDTGSLKTNTFLAIFIIFALLAVQLKGYMAPFVIIANIPLGITGAIYAHWILGHDLSFMSLFGIVALCGVVVNDSVVLIDFYNQMRSQGKDQTEALLLATKRRFRAILLTTLTNGFSTLPILLETSTQAQFLIPMAISLSCGIFFSTTLLFIFTPSLMQVLHDLQEVSRTRKEKLYRFFSDYNT